MSSINALGNPNISGTNDLRSSRTSSRPARENALPSEETHTPAPEFVQLLNRLQQIPQLRQEVIGEVAQRLAGGELLTAGAAAATVKAILSAEMPAS